MLMRRSQKKAALGEDQGLPIVLRTADGQTVCTFGIDAVNSFRHLLTKQACNGGLPNRVAVVAALKGEGTTYTSLALAATLASDTATSVCVVELNWWAPGMLSQLVLAAAQGKRGASAEAQPAPVARPGIADVLAGTVALEDAFIPTNIANLTLLPAGTLPLERRPVVARSEALRAQIELLSQRFDHLIIDVPAILTTSDSMILASLGSTCCLVVRQGVTLSTSVKRALDDIKHLNMMGVVFNRMQVHSPRWLLGLIPQE